MSEHATMVANTFASTLAVWATVYSWLTAFTQQLFQPIDVSAPFADIPLALDQKAAVFAGVAAGVYWTIKAGQLIYKIISSRRNNDRRNDSSLK